MAGRSDACFAATPGPEGGLIEEVDPTLKFVPTSRRLAALAVFLTAFVGTSVPVRAQQQKAASKGIGSYAVPLSRMQGLGDTRLLPSGLARREFVVPGKDGAAKTRVQIGGSNGANVQEQIVDALPTPDIDQLTPFWTEDEQSLFYVSRKSGSYQIYRIGAGSVDNPAQSGLVPETAVTNEAGADHLYPIVNPAGNRILFAKSTDGAPLGDAKIWHLYASNMPLSGTISTTAPGSTNLIPLSLGRSFRGKAFVSVGRACWIGTNDVVFSARLAGESNYHLFSINTTTLTIFQLTMGSADERNPSVSPDSRYLAFDSNAARTTSGVSYTGGTTPRTESVDGDPAVAIGAPGARRNVFVSGAYGGFPLDPNPANRGPRQVTGRYAGAPDLDSVQPAWSSARANIYTNNDGNQYYLAFASNRQPDNAAAPTAFSEAPTNDIYYVVVSRDRGQTLLEEKAPGTGDGARAIDSADPTYIYNDTYPAWSPVVTLTRTIFQSDRTGSLFANNYGNGFTATPGVHDIFLASIVDVTAPTLVRYDTNTSTGEIVHINQGTSYNPNESKRTREDGLLPGQDVFFTVRVDDREAGIDSVYLQFKNPNSKYQSEAQGGLGVEHKEYRTGAAAFLSPTDVPLWTELDTRRTAGLEYECQAITLDGTQYASHRLTGGQIYIAGQDDRRAFSGVGFPPMDGNAGRPNTWLRLQPLQNPDGSPLLPPDGRGGVLYGATWKLPAEASDWFIDVIAYDKAVNPLNTSERQNWIIYDNVWGFSTALPLNPIDRDVLFISDYTLGQKFFRSRAGQIVGSPSNLQGIGFGAESYYTDTEMARYPSEIGQRVESRNADGTINRQWNNAGPWQRGNPFPGTFGGGIGPTAILNPGSVHPLGVGSYVDELIEYVSKVDTNGRTYALPVTGRYTIWRTLARGPVPAELLQAYLPLQVETPADVRIGETTKRTTRVYNRLVVWAAPFTGNLFTGPGSLTDLQTQTKLTSFINEGGRLFVSGQDIGFALAGNGQSSNFFTSVLGARYVADGGAGPTLTSVGGLSLGSWDPTQLQLAWGDRSQTPIGYDPLTARPLDLPTDNGTALDASGTGRYQDVIAPLTGSTLEFSVAGGNAGIISRGNTNGGRVIYSSIGYETIGQQWYLAGNQITMRGSRAKIMSSFAIGYRTATIVGRLTDDQGSPVADALVRAIPNGGAENQAAAGTALTDASGNFQIVGLASGAFSLYGYKAGFYTQHADGIRTHGANTTRIAFNLKRANPGKLTNINPTSTTPPVTAGILALDKQTAIPGIEIQARRTNPDGRITVLSAISRDATDARFPAGSYELKDMLIGDYEILVNAPDTYDNTGAKIDNPNYNPGYDTVILSATPTPARYTLGAGTSVVARNGVSYLVIEEDKTAQIDFYLPSKPQTVRGRVVNKNTDTGIDGAFVTAFSTDLRKIVATATADADGNYTLVTTDTPSVDKLPAGGYTITATALGFSTETASIGVTGTTTVTVPTLKLTPLPPGSVSGNVTGIVGAGISGATVKLYLVRGGVVSTNPTYTTTTGTVGGQGAGYFRVDPVAPGTYVVTVERSGLVSDPVQLQIDVTTGAERTKTDFRLLPPRVYGDGIQLISTPYDYSGTTPRDIFGLTPNGDNDGDGSAGTAKDLALYNQFTVADWTGVDYNAGPNVPILAGKGYFVRFGNITSVAKTGTALPGSSFTLTMAPGWNLVGHPFTNPVSPTSPGQDLDIYANATITDEAGATYTLTEAVQRNLVSGVLFGYTGSNNGSQYYETRTMKPWAGYWFRNMTNQALKFNLNYPATRGLRTLQARTIRRADLEAVPTRSVVSKGLQDWRLQIAARQGALLDTDNTIGVAPGARDGFDNRFDNEKPPMLRQAPGVYVGIEGLDANGRSAAFADMIQDGGTTAVKSWQIAVEATQPGEVTLTWPGINRLPRGIEPVLTDTSTGKRVAMRTGAGAYRFQHTGRGIHRFKVEVRPTVSSPLAVTRVRVQSAGGSRSAGYRISFMATREASIDAEIRTIGGRTLRRFQTRATGATETTLLWDGRDSMGSPLPAGTYVFTVTAQDEMGRVARQQLPIATVR